MELQMVSQKIIKAGFNCSLWLKNKNKIRQTKSIKDVLAVKLWFT